MIATTLDDLEEEPLVEHMGVELKEFTVAFAVVEDLVVTQRGHGGGVEAVFGFDIVVVVVGDLEEIRTASTHIGDRRENIAAGEGDMLNAGAEEFVDEAGRQRASG